MVFSILRHIGCILLLANMNVYKADDVAREAVRHCAAPPVKLRQLVVNSSNDTGAALPRKRRTTSLFASCTRTTKARGAAKGIDADEDVYPDDNADDVEEPAYVGHHFHATHRNKLEVDPPTDPWEKIRTDIKDCFLRQAPRNVEGVKQRKEALQQSIQEKVNAESSRCPSCNIGANQACVPDAPGNKTIKVNQPSLFFPYILENWFIFLPGITYDSPSRQREVKLRSSTVCIIRV